MSPWLIALLDVGIFWFFFGNNILDMVRFGRWKERHLLKQMRKVYRGMLLRDGDLLTEAQRRHVGAQLERLEQLRKEGDAKAIRKFLEEQGGRSVQAKMPPRKSHGWLRNFLELCVVSLGVAFGVRALFLQPFKIPTGSMQPTLYGIHYEANAEPQARTRLGRLFSYLNYSRRPMNLTVVSAGGVDPQGVRPHPSWPLFPSTEVRIGGRGYLLPGEPAKVVQTLLEEGVFADGNHFESGRTLLRGYLVEGDHLFVNRLSLCFREPRRGDVMVFRTDGISMPDGRSLGGSYYVKRLVGLPGDELKIADGKLFVKEPGGAEFRRLSAADHPGFELVQSGKDGYRGYANMKESSYLRTSEESFVVPEGEYFMLGDNSYNSLDSRYWGTVPRRNLVGRPGFVWWPFASHWGFL